MSSRVSSMESYAYAIVVLEDESTRRVVLGLNTTAFVVFYCLTIVREGMSQGRTWGKSEM